MSQTDGKRPDTGRILATLDRIRSRARVLLVIRQAGWILAAIVGVCLVLGLVDYLVRLPVALRGILWVSGAITLVVIVRRHLWPAIRFRPSLTQIALRVERSDASRLLHLLASAVDFMRAEDVDPATTTLHKGVIAEAAEAARTIRPHHVLSMRRTARSISLVLIAGLFVTMSVMGAPESTRIAAARVLAPWMGVEWPRRTAVADATSVRVHPLRTALPLRAVLVRTDRSLGETKIGAKYRVLVNGEAGPTRRVLMTSQERIVELVREDGQRRSGELYERLVDAAQITPEGDDVREAVLEYWFEAEDSRSTTRTLRLVEPPAITFANATVTPPDYVTGQEESFAQGERDLGRGSDERAVLGPVLAGSRIEFTIGLNKPIPVPAVGPDTPPHDWLRTTFGDDPFGEDVRVRLGEHIWTIEWSIAESMRLPVTVVDEHDLGTTDEPVFAIEVVSDQAPTATITSPERDESVLPSAIVEVIGEGRDDVGISRLALEYQRARPPGGSLGAVPEAIEETVEVSVVDRTPGLQARVSTMLDLATLDLQPGDEVWLTALAADTYDFHGQTHEPVRSSVRRLRLISESDLTEQIRAELANVREAAIRLDTDQAELRDAGSAAQPTPEQAGAQRTLTERLARQRERLQRLADRVDRNQLDDSGLANVLDDAQGLLSQSGNASQRAMTGLEQAARDGAEDEARQSAIEEAQDEVRERLAELIEQLDRGEDAWVARRALEQLRSRQQELMEQTQRAGEQTVGRSMDELSEQARSELEQIAERQAALSEQAERMLQDLTERAQSMQESDVATAGALSEAADRGRREQLPEQLEEASERIEQNQTSSAMQQQQQALEAMDEMLEDLDGAEQNRDETLRRLLASVIQSLDALIRQQRRELERLAEAAETGAFEGLDDGMIRMHRNTLGALDQIETGWPELRGLRQLVDEASGFQSEAIVVLREFAVDETKAELQERRSLERLKEARAEAERLDREARERDNRRKLEDLLETYRDVRDQQVVLRSQSQGYVGRALTRRERSEARALADAERALAEQLSGLRSEVAEIDETTMLAFAHNRLNTLLEQIAGGLEASDVASTVTRRQGMAIRLLESVIESLEDQQQEQEDEFREGGADGGGGGGGAGGEGEEAPLIPPMSELLLLRSMQQEVHDLTRDLDDSGTPDDTSVDDLGEMQRSLGELGQELIRKMMETQPGIPQMPEPDAGPDAEPVQDPDEEDQS